MVRHGRISMDAKPTYFIEAGPIGAPGGIPDSEARDVRFDSEAQDGQSGQLMVRPTMRGGPSTEELVEMRGLEPSFGRRVRQ